MVLDGSVLAFTLAAALLTVSPGPDTFLVITSAAHGGVRRGLAVTAGIVSGGVFYVALFALGVARVLVYSPVLFSVVKLCGAAYLLWLGLAGVRSALRREVPPLEQPSPEPGAPGRSLARAWLQGVITNTLNPKVAVFYLAFLPQFMAPGDDVALKSALLIGIHYTLGLVWLSLVSLAVSRMSRLLRRSAVKRVLDGAVGLAMTGFGVRLALVTR